MISNVEVKNEKIVDRRYYHTIKEAKNGEGPHPIKTSNGWIADEDGKVFIYYASCDTRMHVATSSVDVLVDYCLNTPTDGSRTANSVKQINHLIDLNTKLTQVK